LLGNLEDAIHCWSTQASSWFESDTGILLSSGAGALGVCLGMSIRQDGELMERPDLGVRKPANPEIVQSTIGLVWRSLVSWLILLLLLTLASVQV